MQALPTIDQIAYVFTFPFKDPKWKSKFFTAAFLALAGVIFPVIPWLFLMGYQAMTIKSGMENPEPLLPEWDNWNELLKQGFRFVIVSFIFSLPSLALLLGGYLLLMAFPIISGLGAEMLDSPYVFLLLMLFGFTAGMFTMSLGILLMIVSGFFLPASLSHMVAKDSFSAAFQFREWWEILKSNFKGYVIAFLLVSGALMVLVYSSQIVYFTLVLCWTMPILLSLVSAYLSLISAGLFGQVYRVGREKSGS